MSNDDSMYTGRGFGFLTSSMYIKATLNGISLLAKTIPSKDEFIIDADLMWETDKSSIKR